MPPKRGIVSAECAIASIMRFMKRYDNNDSVIVMMVKSVMLKMIWIDLENDLKMVWRQVSFNCMYVFSYRT
jgi:hypothetical protein